MPPEAQRAKFHPCDLELEQAMLGAFLLDNRTIALAAEVLKPSDFSEEIHAHICELAYQFEDEQKPVTPLTLNVWVKSFPDVEKLGGANGYMMKLVEACPSSRPVLEWARILVSLRERRDVTYALEDALDELSSAKPVIQAIKPVVDIVDKVTDSLIAAGAKTQAHDHGDTMMREIDQQALTGEIYGCRTGLEPLDNLIGGLYPEQFIVLGGRPGMGKSILGGTFALAAARQDYAVDWWSIEMSAGECVARALCDIDYDMALQEGLKPLHYEDLVKRRATPGQMERAARANILLRDLDISIFARARVTMDEISGVSRARAARQPGKKRLVVIDHMHIIMPSDRYRGRRVDELSEITGAGKRLAKRLEAPVVELAQLSRDIEKRDNKQPYMSDFRDSGSIEQDADVVASVYRHEYYAEKALKEARDDVQRTKAELECVATKGKLEIGVHKQRSGRTATAEVFIDVKSSVVRSEDPRIGLHPRQAGLDLAPPSAAKWDDPLNTVDTKG